MNKPVYEVMKETTEQLDGCSGASRRIKDLSLHVTNVLNDIYSKSKPSSTMVEYYKKLLVMISMELNQLEAFGAYISSTGPIPPFERSEQTKALEEELKRLRTKLSDEDDEDDE